MSSDIIERAKRHLNNIVNCEDFGLSYGLRRYDTIDILVDLIDYAKDLEPSPENS